MTLKETVYLSLAAVAILIGIHRSLAEGVLVNYWLFMLGFIFLMLYRYTAYRRNETTKQAEPPRPTKKARKKLQRK